MHISNLFEKISLTVWCAIISASCGFAVLCWDESCSGIEYKSDVTNISNLQEVTNISKLHLSESVKCKAPDSSAVRCT